MPSWRSGVVRERRGGPGIITCCARRRHAARARAALLCTPRPALGCCLVAFPERCGRAARRARLRQPSALDRGGGQGCPSLAAQAVVAVAGVSCHGDGVPGPRLARRRGGAGWWPNGVPQRSAGGVDGLPDAHAPAAISPADPSAGRSLAPYPYRGLARGGRLGFAPVLVVEQGARCPGPASADGVALAAVAEGVGVGGWRGRCRAGRGTRRVAGQRHGDRWGDEEMGRSDGGRNVMSEMARASGVRCKLVHGLPRVAGGGQRARGAVGPEGRWVDWSC